MNVDTLNSKYKVVSKYFVGKTVMDESISDFKEKKSFKVTNSKAPAKPKAKKVKRVRGQKDIRTVLKAKKNELIAYSEDFDSVCKKSGIDVDSEQLQLAIALSKSLQTTDSVDSSSLSSKSLTNQQRTGLIRTTLKEYGFKVPEKPTTSRKTKKRRKPYKLLLTSEEEKQQIISDRYSQLLFELNNSKSTTSDRVSDFPNLFIYNMSTNIKYENIKDDSIFYVENIVEESPNSVGCLLKNWSNIPGRPSSPDVNKSELLFSEVECSQEELDIVLSGHFKNSKDILKKNMLKDRGKSPVKRNICKTVVELSPKFVEDNTGNQSPVFISGSINKEINDTDDIESSIKVGNREEKNLLVMTQPSRSFSPDLFDDEDDTIVEIPNETVTETGTANNFTEQASEVMDLTECINAQKNMCNSRNMKTLSQISHQIDVTKRKSNDFMEMTECVGSSSQHEIDKIDEEIDLTGPCENIVATLRNNTHVEIPVVVECDGDSSLLIVKEDEEHNIDLTAECEIEKNINASCTENVHITNSNIFLEGRTDEHIDLTEHCVGGMDNNNNNNSVNADNIEHMDLTQSSNTSGDSLPFVQVGGTQAAPEKSLDDTIILNENDYLETKSPEGNKEFHASDEQPNQDPNTSNIDHAIEMISPKHISVETDEAQIINLDESEVPEVNDDNVDLTQAADSNEANTICRNNSHHINNSSLGKKDNMSVDYDEALENMNCVPYYDNENYNNETIVTEDHLEKTNDNEVLSKSKLPEPSNDINFSCNSMVNYFDFGGISVIDNLHSFNDKSRHTNRLPNGSMRDSLPMVDVKGTEKPKSPLKHPKSDPISHKSLNEKPPGAGKQTPKTKVDRHVTVETPEQSEYIVKTDNVTPMLDYASMSTPERNRELDKYGLKPFKRKRAIQLLTHLYNQTHPYVESAEELPSPSKKRKTENLSQPSSSKSSSTSISPRKATKSPKKSTKSPRKATKSPRKASRSTRTNEEENLNYSDKENDLFLETRDAPVIRNVECDADDWVFQKREKAKLHTCRVPLHIAFHNYVSCRLRLHEAILRYEPVNIDVMHKELAASGHRYDPKDLLKFLDKRCITVKTADNTSTKNNKRY